MFRQKIAADKKSKLMAYKAYILHNYLKYFQIDSKQTNNLNFIFMLKSKPFHFKRADINWSTSFFN